MSSYEFQYLRKRVFPCYGWPMDAESKHLTDGELEGLALAFEEELADAEQGPGCTWHRTTLWLCSRTLRRFKDSPSAV